MPRKRTPESYVLQAVCEYLAAEKIFHMRMNVGAVRTEGGGFMRFGTPGCADVLAFVVRFWTPFPEDLPDGVAKEIVPMWLECKAEKGQQSEAQKSFQQRVKAEGHRYCIIRSIDDLKEALQ